MYHRANAGAKIPPKKTNAPSTALESNKTTRFYNARLLLAIFTDSLRQLYKYFEAAQTHRKTTLIITAYYCNIATRPLQHTSAMYATRVNRQSETVN